MLKDWLIITENPDEIQEVAKRIVTELMIYLGEEKRRTFLRLLC